MPRFGLHQSNPPDGLDAALTLLARGATARNAVLEPAYDDVLIGYALHAEPSLGQEVLLALPMDRRESQILAVVPGRFLSSQYWRLCPTEAVAARTVRSAIDESPPLGADETVRALTSFGGLAVPALRASLEDPQVRNRELLERALQSLQMN